VEAAGAIAEAVAAAAAVADGIAGSSFSLNK